MNRLERIYRKQVALPLQRFQSIDLALDLAIAPDFSDGVADGGGILA